MQPIFRSAVLEEIEESLVPAPLVADGEVVAEHAVRQHHRAADSGKAQIRGGGRSGQKG